MTDFKDPNHTGNYEHWLNCPECDFVGLIYYNTQPPLYCSPACKQRAYRKRKVTKQMRNTASVTHLLNEFQEQGFRDAALAKLATILTRWGEEAAQEAAALATITAREVRQQTRSGF